ncbi:MAG: glycosyltransferase family 39 protein [Planctomycetota bacterium]
MTWRPASWWSAVAAVVLLHSALALGYAFITPAFEAPDENGHYYYASFVAQRGEQPTVMGWHRQSGGSPFDEADLGHHPPLYYGLLALALRALDLVDSLPSPRPSGSRTGALHWQHGYDERIGPSHEIRCLRVLRGISVLCGAFSILLVIATARVLWPGQDARAVLAGLTLACIPQWSHAHGSLDNGNLATTLACLTTYLLARTLDRREIRWRDGILLGLTFALGLWTKANALALGPPIVVVIAVLCRIDGRWRRQPLVAGGLALLIAALAYTPLLVRNLSRYGDPLGQSAHAAAFAQSRVPDGELWAWLTHGFPYGLFRSFVGMFGWWRVGVSDAWLGVALLLVVLAAIGAVGRSRAKPTGAVRGRALLLWTLGAATFAFVLRYNLTFAQPQGRYLFPAAAAIAIGLSVGWSRLAQRLRSERIILGGLAAALVVGATVTLTFLVRPAFTLPPVTNTPHEAILFGGLTRAGTDTTDAVTLIEPADGEVRATSPTFRWKLAPGASPHSLRIWRDDGRLLGATYEMLRLDLSHGEFTLPDELWSAVAPGSALHWNIAEVCDRSRAGDARRFRATATRTLVRQR